MNSDQYFRAMAPAEDGLPSIGPSKRSLGAVANETNAPDGTFGPGTGGMSVAPKSPWNMPHHRRPRWMGNGSTGPKVDGVFGITDGAFLLATLTARLDPVNPGGHAFVEPLSEMTYVEYSNTLASTRSDWRRHWPQDLA